MEQNTVKPGWKTTEFWLGIIPQVLPVLALVLGNAHPAVLIVNVVGGIVSKFYTADRTQLKAKALDMAVAAARAAAEAIPQKPGVQ